MNVLTEDEAKTKWCPFVRVAGFVPAEDGLNVAVSNRHPDPTIMEQTRCIGSACMAWRWQPLMTDGPWREAVKQAAIELDDKTSGRAKAAAHVNANLAKYGLPDKPYRGFCGLAGRPE